MNQHLEDIIPSKEKPILVQLRGLPSEEKKLLWEIIKNTSKDGIAVYLGPKSSLDFLLGTNLISHNYMYKGPGISLFVLKHAPYLLRKLAKAAN